MKDSSDVLVEAQGLCKNYGDTRAVDGLSLSVKRGEIIGILGANGAGKTTTMHMLLGLLLPTSGDVKVLGRSPCKDRHAICGRINFSSAYAYLPSNLTVQENLFIFSSLYAVKNRKAKIDELLELFEIAHLRYRLVGALSSGEKTKLNLAKSFVNDPELLILDEPTASLDPDMSEKVRRTLKKIQAENNLGIVYTSHNMFEVETLCDRVVFIHHGRKITEGTPSEIQKAFAAESLEHTFIKIVRGGEIVEGENS